MPTPPRFYWTWNGDRELRLHGTHLLLLLRKERFNPDRASEGFVWRFYLPTGASLCVTRGNGEQTQVWRITKKEAQAAALCWAENGWVAP